MNEKKKKEEDVRFSRFGTVSFTSITRVNDFIDFLDEGMVMGTRCRNCGAIYFPPRADCCRCLASDFEWFEVEGTGTLMAFSKLKYAPVGFENDLPYHIAVVDYGTYKVFGRISGDVPDEEIEIGMAMTTAANPLGEGKLNYVFKKA